MPRPLKVYGWTSHRLEANDPRNQHNKQTREICAARSAAEVARLAGVLRPSQLFNLNETGNTLEIKLAMTYPQQVLWRPLDLPSEPWANATTGLLLPRMLEQETPQEHIRNAMQVLKQWPNIDQGDVDAVMARLRAAALRLEGNY